MNSFNEPLATRRGAAILWWAVALVLGAAAACVQAQAAGSPVIYPAKGQSTKQASQQTTQQQATQQQAAARSLQRTTYTSARSPRAWKAVATR